MSEPNRQDDLDAALWRRYASAAGGGEAGKCPEAMELASWLDGRAEPALAERIEAHLAACPDCLQAAADLRALLAAPPMVAPAKLGTDPSFDGVKRRVVAGGKSKLGSVPSFASFAAGLWLRVGRWAAVAAAAVVVSFAGFSAGAGMRHSRQAVQAAVVHEATFGLEDGQAEGRLAEEEPAGDMLAALMEGKP